MRFGSIDDARRAFAVYARVEPRLWPLWDLCRRAAPPIGESELVDDAYDVDPFEHDVVAAGTPHDGWCAEDFFFESVKSRLLLLAGGYRPGEPHALQSSDAYDTLYDILIHWALRRTCACCAEPDDPWNHRDVGSPAYR